MSRLVTPSGVFRLYSFESEKDFERCVVEHAAEIFGSDRIYLDCKRRIGGRGGKQSIPDAYLIDLSRKREPQLYVVENELASHELFKHIGVQLLQFSVSFRDAGRQVKEVLFEEISAEPTAREMCEKYARDAGLRNVDRLLDYLVFETPFRALVVIDEVTDELTNVLKNFGFPVEVIEFVTYEDDKGVRIYRFSPFLEDVEAPVGERLHGPIDLSEIDTVVVPAREDGFQETFLGENRWWAVRIHPSMASQIRYIAAYRIAPTSAITHWAPVRSIEPWKDTGKVVVNFSEPAKETGPIRLVKGGHVKALQNLRYTSFEKLKTASNLDEAF